MLAKRHMGMKTTRPGSIIPKNDVSIAKNYLDAEEMNALYRMVSAFIEFAELQALNRRPMTMRDWFTKLDELLKLTERDLLDHTRTISADNAKAKAELSTTATGRCWTRSSAPWMPSLIAWRRNSQSGRRLMDQRSCVPVKAHERIPDQSRSHRP